MASGDRMALEIAVGAAAPLALRSRKKCPH